MALQYQEFQAQPALRDYIACFWRLVASPEPNTKPVRHRVLPDCCADIIFDFSGARARSPAYFVGTMTSPISFMMGGAVNLLGIRFRAGAARSFLKVPLAESTDLTIDLECFWRGESQVLMERLAGAKEIAAKIAILEGYLLRNFADSMNLDPYVEFSVKKITQSRGVIAISDIEQGTGLSLRQLERKFIREIGIGPKAFSRIARFMSVMENAKSISHPDWSTLALAHGYSDQSHLVREFKAFSGLTPSVFIAEQ